MLFKKHSELFFCLGLLRFLIIRWIRNIGKNIFISIILFHSCIFHEIVYLLAFNCFCVFFPICKFNWWREWIDIYKTFQTNICFYRCLFFCTFFWLKIYLYIISCLYKDLLTDTKQNIGLIFIPGKKENTSSSFHIQLVKGRKENVIDRRAISCVIFYIDWWVECHVKFLLLLPNWTHR